ncbi:MAG: DUF349 domain-containing protein [Bacteroidota bacterium]|nr:DUF349 domain-containing protein [Bacteroidota bacterium]
MKNKEADIAQGTNPYGYIIENKIFRKSFLDYPDLEIGVVKTSPEESFKYFESKFGLLEAKIQKLFDEIEKAENKGSYLQKLLHLKSALSTFVGIGNFENLHKILSEKELELIDNVGKNRQKNLLQKQALLRELENEKPTSDWINAGEKIKEVKNKWLRIGPIDKDQEEKVELAFQKLLEDFYQRRQTFFDERKELARVRLEKYKYFAERSTELLHSTDMKNAVIEMKKISEDWKNVGKVPKADLEPYITKYKSNKKAFFKKISDYKRNKAKVVVLSPAEKIKALMKLNEDLVNVLDQMPPDGEDLVKRMQDKWKKIGYVPNSQEYKQLEYLFRTNSQKTIDSYFLRKTAIRTEPKYLSMTPAQQVRFQIGLIKEFIQRDAQQIDNFENNFNRTDYNGREETDVFEKKLIGLKRALIVKQSLLKDLESKLLIK